MNIYEELGLRRVINASGKMTALGISAVCEEVILCASDGARNYVVIDELIDKAGEIISKYTGGEDSLPTNSASAGICLSVAGLIAKDNIKNIYNMPNSDGLKNEIIIQKGHNVNYGTPVQTMISLGGGKVVEVGYANETNKEHIKQSITDNTVALIYIKSHHCVQKGMVSLEDMIKIANDNNIPIIVDGAAEGDLTKYINIGADIVIYSGAKAIEATTTGFITGKKEYIYYAKMQYKGIGRAMKVGKENICGLLKSLEIYSKIDFKKKQEKEYERAKCIVDRLQKIEGINANISKDEAGRDIYRAEVKICKKTLGIDAKDVMKKLNNSDPAIYVRKHKINLGYITFDVRALKKDDVDIIIKSVENIVKESLYETRN